MISEFIDLKLIITLKFLYISKLTGKCGKIQVKWIDFVNSFRKLIEIKKIIRLKFQYI